MEDKNLKKKITEAAQRIVDDPEFLEIEDKGQLDPDYLIEDKGETEAENEAAAEMVDEEPVVPAKKKNWFGWWVAALFALCVIGLCIYFATRDSMVSHDSDHFASTFKTGQTFISATGGGLASNNVKAGGVKVYGKYPMATEKSIDAQADGARNVDYLYYFGNDQSAVGSNALLDEVAAKAKATDAEITITAYASNTGSAAYNAALCKKRAVNLENYLINHGVKADHIKILSGGQTEQFGGAAYNRRADISVNYGS